MRELTRMPQEQDILDKRFRAGSARKGIAQALLSGEPQDRHELAQMMKTAPTAVNAVVDMLTEEGCYIRSWMDGRRAIFQLMSIGPPPHPAPFPALKGSALLTGAQMVGTDYLVDFRIGTFRYRGKLKHLLKGEIPVGQKGIIVSVVDETETSCGAVLEFKGGRKLALVGVKTVTA